MASPNRDQLHPSAGKMFDTADAVFDLTEFLKTLSTLVSTTGLPVNSEGGAGAAPGGAMYSNLSSDFTATANNGTKTITLSAYASAVLSAVISAKHIAAATFFKITTAGVVTKLPTTTVSISANVITLSDMSGNFVTTDTVAVFIPGPEKAFTAASDIYKFTDTATQALLAQPTVPTAVTPSDSTDLTTLATKGIFVSVPLGVTTTVAFKLTGSGTAVTLPLYASQYLPGAFSRVMSTNTTLNGATIVAYS